MWCLQNCPRTDPSLPRIWWWQTLVSHAPTPSTGTPSGLRLGCAQHIPVLRVYTMVCKLSRMPTIQTSPLAAFWWWPELGAQPVAWPTDADLFEIFAKLCTYQKLYSRPAVKEFAMWSGFALSHICFDRDKKLWKITILTNRQNVARPPHRSLKQNCHNGPVLTYNIITPELGFIVSTENKFQQ